MEPASSGPGCPRRGDVAAGRLLRPFKIALPLDVSYFLVSAKRELGTATRYPALPGAAVDRIEGFSHRACPAGAITLALSPKRGSADPSYVAACSALQWWSRHFMVAEHVRPKSRRSEFLCCAGPASTGSRGGDRKHGAGPLGRAPRSSSSSHGFPLYRLMQGR